MMTETVVYLILNDDNIYMRYATGATGATGATDARENKKLDKKINNNIKMNIILLLKINEYKFANISIKIN